ncbi:MAG: SDR family oxidoreductase, partial [Acidimicrobiaceae bacterium]|nr:SDR family oxidoreductase [Acidimicrobiaceae bacterium]
MSIRQLAGTTAIVTGASRGFGQAISASLVREGAYVVGVARSAGPLNELRDQLGERFTPEIADITDPDLARRLVSQHQPRTIVLNAGATPPMGPISQQTWETFTTNWNTDVRHVFNFAREALTMPLDSGSVVLSFSSGAALRGSPLSGGYSGAKATVRYISAYAGSESSRGSLGIRFVSVLPQLTPATKLGTVGVETYAGDAGLTVDAFVERMGTVLSPEKVATSVVTLVTD